VTAQIVTENDTARTRRTDPLPSHVAGDTSQKTKQRVSDAVLVLLRQEEELDGQELNDMYELRAARSGWPKVHIDSPRKRAGDLVREGHLIVTNPDDPRGTPHRYRIRTEAD